MLILAPSFRRGFRARRQEKHWPRRQPAAAIGHQLHFENGILGFSDFTGPVGGCSSGTSELAAWCMYIYNRVSVRDAERPWTQLASTWSQQPAASQVKYTRSFLSRRTAPPSLVGPVAIGHRLRASTREEDTLAAVAQLISTDQHVSYNFFVTSSTVSATH